MALRILTAAQTTEKVGDINTIWNSFTKKEKKVILEVLKKEAREDLFLLLTQT